MRERPFRLQAAVKVLQVKNTHWLEKYSLKISAVYLEEQARNSPFPYFFGKILLQIFLYQNFKFYSPNPLVSLT